ncbi:MAG: Ig-like domain-containing protein, partial [Bacteroidaceae bacterium]|nr:Ig-like domain-containing protein [Bacteroidaceae bacterium]
KTIIITKITVTYGEGTPVEKAEAGLAYTTTEFTINLGDAFTAPTLTNPNNLTVSYASSDEEVATVDAEGKVTIVGAGTTTITASSEETEAFYAGTASYKLTVNEVVAPYENIAALIAANLKNGTVVSVKLTNAQVQYVNTTTKDLFIADETAGIDLYQTSLEYTQGQILNGVLTGPWSPFRNLPELKDVDATGVTVTEGTIEPKVIAASEVKDNVCRLVKIENQTAVESEGNYYIDNDIQLYDKYGIGTYYTTNPADYVGIAVVFNTIYELNVISFTEVEMAETIKVGPAGYATYVTKNAVEFNGVKAYAVTAINEKSVSLQELTSAPAGTPVVVEAEEGEYPCTIIESAEAPEKNELTYSEEDVVSDGTIYALANKPEADGVGFYPVKSGVTIPAGKAYLVVGAEVKGFLALGDVADAINNLFVETANGTIFNIAGQKVQNITKGGLYIVNGKKVIVK